MKRRTFWLITAMLVAVLAGCSGDDEPSLISADDAAALDAAADSDSRVDSNGGDLSDVAVVTTLRPARDSVEIVDGVARLNTMMPIPSLWVMNYSGFDDSAEGIGMSVYRIDQTSTSVAWAFGDECGTVIFEASLAGTYSDAWVVDEVTHSEFTCDSPVDALFDKGVRFDLDLRGSFAAVGLDRVLILGQMFESFSDQGDPRRDPAGAIEGRETR